VIKGRNVVSLNPVLLRSSSVTRIVYSYTQVIPSKDPKEKPKTINYFDIYSLVGKIVTTDREGLGAIIYGDSV